MSVQRRSENEAVNDHFETRLANIRRNSAKPLHLLRHGDEVEPGIVVKDKEKETK